MIDTIITTMTYRKSAEDLPPDYNFDRLYRRLVMPQPRDILHHIAERGSFLNVVAHPATETAAGKLGYGSMAAYVGLGCVMYEVAQNAQLSSVDAPNYSDPVGSQIAMETALEVESLGPEEARDYFGIALYNMANYAPLLDELLTEAGTDILREDSKSPEITALRMGAGAMRAQHIDAEFRLFNMG